MVDAMATILVLTPNTLLDHLAVGTFTSGTTNRVDRFTPIAGGKGLNVGRVLARHGHRVISCGFAGGDSGTRLEELTQADGLESAFTRTNARTRVGFCVADPKGKTSAAIEGGFAVEPKEAGQLVLDVQARLAECQLVIGCGSVPDTTCNSLYRLVLAACAKAGVACWIDAYGPAMIEALTGGNPPTLSKPNRDEYDHDRAWLSTPELHLTDGNGSVHVRHPQGRFRIVPPTITQINPIGSGDCYIAALAHARLSGLPLPEQLRYAAAAGAANAARADVARIGPADIIALADQASVYPATDEPQHEAGFAKADRH
jgi:fructose-1-phosphate kinase PfkB-like protein